MIFAPFLVPRYLFLHSIDSSLVIPFAVVHLWCSVDCCFVFFRIPNRSIVCSVCKFLISLCSVLCLVRFALEFVIIPTPSAFQCRCRLAWTSHFRSLRPSPAHGAGPPSRYLWSVSCMFMCCLPSPVNPHALLTVLMMLRLVTT